MTTRFTQGRVFTAAGINAALDELQASIDELRAVASGADALMGGTGGFYADDGAAVRRFGDRTMMGAAADNPALRNCDAAPTDWLSSLMATTSIGAYPVWGAQSASLARKGSIGFLAGSRTSDARAGAAELGYTPSSIGIAAWAINDDLANPTTTTAYAYYGEVWRMPGANFQPGFGMELEAVNFGGLPVGITSPYNINVGGGLYAFQIGSGGGQTSGTSDAAAVFTVVPNPSRFQKGFVFKADALTGTNGTAADAGYGSAVSLARGQAVDWYAPDNADAAACFIRSVVTQFLLGSRVEFQDGGVVFLNQGGQQIFAARRVANPSSSLYTEPGTGLQAAKLRVAQEPGGSGNLGLYPAPGAEIETTGTVDRAGQATPATVGAGFLHINVNGASLRVPLYTSTQAGA